MKKTAILLALVSLSTSAFSQLAPMNEKVELGREWSNRLADQNAFMMVVETKWDAGKAKFFKNVKYYNVQGKFLLDDNANHNPNRFNPNGDYALLPVVDIRITPVESSKVYEDGAISEKGHWAVGYHRDVKVGIDTMLTVAAYSTHQISTIAQNDQAKLFVKMAANFLTYSYLKGTNGQEDTFLRLFSSDFVIGFDYQLAKNFIVRILAGVRSTNLASTGQENFVRLELPDSGVFVEYANAEYYKTDVTASKYFDRLLRLGWSHRW